MKISRGFTLIEAMVVVAIIGILAAIAMPSYLYKIVREQIASGMELSDIAKKPIALSWQLKQAMPALNADVGLPVADKIVNNYVSSIAVQDGAIHITFGNHASGAIKGKVLSLRPAVISDAPVVPVTWVCAGADAPAKMTVMGVDKTTVPATNLPLICRSKAKPG